MKTFVALAVTVFVLMAITDLAQVGRAHAAEVHAPLGYQLMCLKHPAECRGGGAASFEAIDGTLALLMRVNEAVNRAIRPRHDAGADLWTVGARSGDCEDYALEKRRQLIKAGLPASALRLAYVKTRAGAGHAVLIVNTPHVRYVLDNLTAEIRPLERTGYRLVSMQGADPDIWI
jgi:predicted transglutaminase-like cysteine proteinase